MKATILLGTLKKTGLSNTATLCEFLTHRMEKRDIQCETIKLVEYEIPPGTYTNMGARDEWPSILEKVLASQVIVLATPVWWNNQSSLIQRVIERLDELHDEIMAGKGSRLDGKVGGIVITGDSDGAQSIIASLCNFFNALGVIVPPFGTLSILWEGQAKNKQPKKDELLRKYESDYGSTADKMVEQMLRFVKR